MPERTDVMTPHEVLAVLTKPAHLRRTGGIALLVGTWLTAVNQTEAILAGAWSGKLLLRVLLNYLTPLVVSNAGLLSRTGAGKA